MNKNFYEVVKDIKPKPKSVGQFGKQPEAADELRMYLALCTIKKLDWCLDAYIQRRLREHYGFKFCSRAVRLWMSSDPVCCALWDVFRSLREPSPVAIEWMEKAQKEFVSWGVKS